MKKCKTVISVGNKIFFYISDDETDFTIEFASRNLVTLSNFVGFQDSQNFMFLETPGVE